MSKGQQLKALGRQVLVKAVVPDSEGRKAIKRVRTQCYLNGRKLTGAARRHNCVITTKRTADAVTVKATPTCSVGLRFRTRIVAKAAGATRTVWQRNWGVAADPKIPCRLPGNG